MDRYDVMAALYRAAVDRADEAETQRLEIAIEGEPAPVPKLYHARPYALWYAEHGFPVFPLTANAKTPLKASRGLLDATTDIERVAIMFDYQQWNIGIATGHNYDVIDIDGDEGVTTIVVKLSENGDYFGVPIQAISATPRGVHLWVAASGRGNTARILPGVDYRGKGGYVVAPPSRLLDDVDDGTYYYENYRWLMPPKGDA